MSIVVEISIMTTIWKSRNHSTSTGTNVEKVQALYQKKSAHELGRPSNKASLKSKSGSHISVG